MDCNRMEILARRWFAAETTPAEEAELARELDSLAPERLAALSPDLRAAAAMMRDARRLRGQSVNIRTRAALQPLRIAVATAFSAAAIVVAAMLMSRPTVYGYVNGAPVTSLAEARQHSERMFSDLAKDMQPTADAVDKLLLTLD